MGGLNPPIINMIKEEWQNIILKLKECDACNYNGFYSGYSLLMLKALNDEVPEIFLCTGNRTAGKTFFFKRLSVRLFTTFNFKFMILTRKLTQINAAAESFISDIKYCEDFRKYRFSTDKYSVRGVVCIKINDLVAGYVTYLNNADQIKESSNMFNDVEFILKDEFQSETNDYVEDEITKLRSIHKSVSRGYNQPIRFVPTVLISNEISIINPYYVRLGITKRMRSETKKLRGDGWVLQKTYNENVSKLSEQSSFEKAFGNDSYSLANNHNIYLDNLSFIEKIDSGKMMLFLQFVCDKKIYGIFLSSEIAYVSNISYIKNKTLYCFKIDDHTENTEFLSRSNIVVKSIIKYFNSGNFRFKNIESKIACIDLFSYTVY